MNGDYWVTTDSDDVDCPAGRAKATAIWTGDTGNPVTSNKMIVWGGQYNDGAATYYETGGIYDPDTNTWTSTSTGGNCPGKRTAHEVVWTGNTGNPATSYKMIIWGGREPGVITYKEGGIYDPETDFWTPTSSSGNCPDIRHSFTSVWTGNTGNPATENRMIVWGGKPGGGNPLTNTGGIYNPATNLWTATSTGGKCPEARTFFDNIENDEYQQYLKLKEKFKNKEE